MRNRYGYNAQVVNWAGFNQLLPMGYIEVVPGETVSGSVEFSVRSQPTKLAVDTRAYLDAFCFYVPHRLSWEGFPSFVAGGGGAVPLITNLFDSNFEQRYTTTSATNYDRNAPWLRNAYNMIWNQFFRRKDDSLRTLGSATVSAPTNTIGYVSQRPSSLETKFLESPTTNFDTTFALAGTSPNQTVSLNVMRAAMAVDRWGRMRAYYGNRYTDYLKALGVEVEWSLLDEPEVIAQRHTDWKYRITPQESPSATAPNNVVGQAAGQFFSNFKLPIKKSFIPEHGLLCFYVVTRADPLYVDGQVPTALCKDNVAHFWSPEFESMIGSTQTIAANGLSWQGSIPDAVFYPAGAVARAYGFRMLQFEEYRTGQNYNRKTTGFAVPAYNLASSQAIAGPADYQPDVADYLANFTQASDQQYQSVAQYRLIRNSPVARIDTRLKLS